GACIGAAQSLDGDGSIGRNYRERFAFTTGNLSRPCDNFAFALARMSCLQLPATGFVGIGEARIGYECAVGQRVEKGCQRHSRRTAQEPSAPASAREAAHAWIRAGARRATAVRERRWPRSEAYSCPAEAGSRP